MGLRLTAAWAETIGLASLSNVAVLGRLRNAVAWLECILARLLGQASAGSQLTVAGGRLIRLVDATTVRKAGKSARESGRLWRVHAVFDLPAERFSAFELTDEKGAERINRIKVIPGELRIADAVHCRADELADCVAQGGDVLVRAAWTGARWQEEASSTGRSGSDATPARRSRCGSSPSRCPRRRRSRRWPRRARRRDPSSARSGPARSSPPSG
jgi:hypothetical protein